MSIQLQASATATLSITGGASAACASNPTHASTRMEGGKAVFENDNYRITAGDDNRVLIQNKHTGETYEAWGDPHVKVDGQQAFDFWGTTSFQLEDGTKVTIETTPWANNPNATLSSKVTITNGDYGVQITGVDTNTRGDLQIHEAAGWGRTLDWAVDDGNLLQENPAGRGFLAVDSQGRIHAVDQAWINQTDLLKGGKPAGGDAQTRALAHAFKNAFALFSGLVSISFLGGFLAGYEAGAAQGRGHHHGHHRGHHGGERPTMGIEPWLGGALGVQLSTTVSLMLLRA